MYVDKNVNVSIVHKDVNIVLFIQDKRSLMFIVQNVKQIIN